MNQASSTRPSHIKPELTELKHFALTMSWAFPAVFAGLLPWLFDYQWHWWPFTISTLLMSLYVLHANWLLYPFTIWMRITSAIGWVNTRVILGFCFYGLFVPIGQLMKRLGKLDYRDKISAEKRTNYQMNTSRSERKRLEEPF